MIDVLSHLPLVEYRLVRSVLKIKVSQSFIYDKHSRYVSASNTSLCLDGQSLSQLKVCDMSLSQRWQWVKGTDKLSNLYDGRILGHNKSTRSIRLIYRR